MDGFVTKDRAYYYSGITRITVNGKNAYELKGKFLDDLLGNAFSGTNGEDAVEHIEYFLKIVDPINLLNMNYERIRLAIFLISLVGNASKWFDEFKGSITNWVDLTRKIFGKYYPPSHTSRITLQDYWWKVNDHKCSPFSNWRNHIRVPYSNYYSNAHDEEEREDKERCYLVDDTTRDASVCKVRKFEMIKYSFGQDEKYVAIKKFEYNDLTRTNEDACRAYQEIFHSMDEGWVVTRAE
ncbi:hypothetical protein Tco_1260840 [Tanacetum coccineum]